jgi:hypothetical protein
MNSPHEPEEEAGQQEATIQKAYWFYEKQWGRAIADMAERDLTSGSDQEQLRCLVRKSLGIREEWIPQMDIQKERELPQDGFHIEFLTFRSYPGVRGSAHLYVPAVQDDKQPFILLCCGHGEHGKLNIGYQAAARRLVRQGAYVLIPDLIGQGERVTMGHGKAVLPFACGMSVQGLIVMETMAWVRWALLDSRFDTRRIAAAGNSGGGTLTMFLSALCPELSVLSSSGYPSSLAYIVGKEKRHCHCNLIPGAVGGFEMWELYSLFAPKPLFLFGGKHDSLIPEDLFYSCVRKVGHIYELMGAKDKLQFKSLPSDHPWDSEKRFLLSAFLAEHLHLAPPYEMEDDTADCLDETYTCFDEWPSDALTTDEIAVALSGRQPDPDLKLWDVYPLRVKGTGFSEEGLRGAHRQIFAQYEASLWNGG